MTEKIKNYLEQMDDELINRDGTAEISHEEAKRALRDVYLLSCGKEPEFNKSFAAKKNPAVTEKNEIEKYKGHTPGPWGDSVYGGVAMGIATKDVMVLRGVSCSTAGIKLRFASDADKALILDAPKLLDQIQSLTTERDELRAALNLPLPLGNQSNHQQETSK